MKKTYAFLGNNSLITFPTFRDMYLFSLDERNKGIYVVGEYKYKRQQIANCLK